MCYSLAQNTHVLLCCPKKFPEVLIVGVVTTNGAGMRVKPVLAGAAVVFTVAYCTYRHGPPSMSFVLEVIGEHRVNFPSRLSVTDAKAAPLPSKTRGLNYCLHLRTVREWRLDTD